jgi:hypothetical protein
VKGQQFVHCIELDGFETDFVNLEISLDFKIAREHEFLTTDGTHRLFYTADLLWTPE